MIGQRLATREAIKPNPIPGGTPNYFHHPAIGAEMLELISLDEFPRLEGF